MSELYVILARPQNALNIGSVVRLANNFGVAGVRTSGIEDFDRHKACITAPNLEKEVSAVQCIGTFDETIMDINLKFGFTARHRKYQGTVKYVTPKEAAKIAFSMREQAPKIAIIGGAEDSGLLNDEINQLDYAVTIPTAEFQSLNLAMAMAIAMYEFFQIFNQQLGAQVQTDFNDILATPDELKITENVVGEFLGDIDFFKAENSDANYVTISRLMKKMSLTNQENRYLLAVLKHLIYLTKEKL